MQKIIAQTISLPAAKFFSAVAVIIIIQLLFKNQIIVGSLVNAVLICSLYLFGLREAIGIAILPSLFALLFGIIPPVLGPFVPFIIAGNIILIAIFYLFKNNYALGAALGPLVKFLFLFFSSSVIFSFIFGKGLPENVLAMMSYPQLITAILGSVLAFMVLKYFKKYE